MCSSLCYCQSEGFKHMLPQLQKVPSNQGVMTSQLPGTRPLPLILHRCDQQLRKQPLAWPRQKSRQWPPSPSSWRREIPEHVGSRGTRAALRSWDSEGPTAFLATPSKPTLDKLFFLLFPLYPLSSSVTHLLSHGSWILNMCYHLGNILKRSLV